MAKLGAELSSIYSDFNNSIDKQDRNVKIEHPILNSKDAFTSVIEKNEELSDLAHKTEDPDADCRNLKQLLEILIMKNEEIMPTARGYNDSFQDKETVEQYASQRSK